MNLRNILFVSFPNFVDVLFCIPLKQIRSCTTMSLAEAPVLHLISRLTFKLAAKTVTAMMVKAAQLTHAIVGDVLILSKATAVEILFVK